MKTFIPDLNTIAQGDALKAIKVVYAAKVEHSEMARSINQHNATLRNHGGFPSENMYVSREDREYIRDVGRLLREIEKLTTERDAERERCAQIAWTTVCPAYGPLDNPISVLSHAIHDAILQKP